MSSLGKRMAKGAGLMVLFRFLERSLGLISTLVLARLLVPADFGVMAMAMSVIAVIEIVNGFSFDLALIQKQNTERHHYDTAWTLNVLVYTLMALLMVAVAGPTAAFYREPRVEPVLQVLAIGVFLQGFENIGIVDFRKHMNVKKDFTFLVARKLTGVTVGIVLALLFHSYWALVGSMLVVRVVGIALSYAMHPFRPRLSLTGARELLHFSKWMFANFALVGLTSRAPDFIVGRVAGPTALGIYNLGFELSNLPTTELVMPMNRVIFPGYAKMANDPNQLGEGFLAVISLVALIAIPAAAGIALVAEPLVLALLGQKWAGVAPVIQVLAFYGLFTALQTNAWHLFVAGGRPNWPALLGALTLVVLVPAMLYGVHAHGVVGAGMGAVAASVATLPVTYALVRKLLNLRLRDYFFRFWRPLAGTAAMAIVVTQWMGWLGTTGHWDSHLIVSLSSVLVGAVAYAVMVFVLWRVVGRPAGAEASLLGVLWARLRREEPVAKGPGADVPRAAEGGPR